FSCLSSRESLCTVVRSCYRILWGWTGGSTGYGEPNASHLDAGARRAARRAVRAGVADGRDRPPPGADQKCRHRPVEPECDDPPGGAAEATAAQRLRIRRAELPVAARPSERRQFPLLRRPPVARQALLPRACGDRLYPAERWEVERR